MRPSTAEAATLSSLFKSLSTVGSYTFVSRILGLVRDQVFAWQFGADAATDAFFVAFKIPNFLRRLFAEGAFATAFVPVLTEYKTQRSFAELKGFVDHVAGTLAMVLLGVSLVGVIAAPVVVSVFGFGWYFDGKEGQLGMAAEMLRLTFPYLLFISLTAFAGGILNAHGRFAVPAFTPVLLNLSLIGCALWLSPLLDTPVVALAWGVLIAGIAQLTFQLPFLHQLKLLPSLRPRTSDAGVRRVLRLMVPALFAVSVTQINLLLDTVLASFLVAGSISWLYFSDRLMEFPLGVLGVALGTVILPKLSQKQAEASPEGFRHTLDWGLRTTLVFGLPAAVGLALLAGPILTTLFQYKAFSPDDVVMARQSLIAYAVGLPAFILIKVLAPGYYARQDTRTPVKYAVIAMFVNMALNLALIVPLKHAGLALATSLAAYLNAFLLYRGLRQRGVYQPASGWRPLGIWLAAGLVDLGAVLWFLAPPLDYWLAASLQGRIVGLLLWIGVGVLAYFVTMLVLGMRPRHLRAQP
jgi:putative peptidoglycan lipid II flippase